MTDVAALKAAAQREVEQVTSLLLRTSDWMADNPELGLQEYQRDPVLAFIPVEPMRARVTDLRECVLVPGAGHWIQQERPAETNEALLRFLASVLHSRA